MKPLRKEEPVLVRDTAFVYPTRAEQFREVARLAIEQSATAPVVIITAASSLAEALLREIESQGAINECAPVLFLQHGSRRNGVPLTWSAAVELSTQPITNAAGRRCWPITVTDYFGGRGHDFRINDPQVDQAGGLTVIATCIPPNEREWAQWLGRTARNDRRGRFAVILSEEDEPVQDQSSTPHRVRLAVISEHRRPGATREYTPKLVSALLGVRDQATKAALDALSNGAVHRGQLMNELCDIFYEEFGPGAPWPGVPGSPHEQLRDFLASWYRRELVEIPRFAVRVLPHK
jgi:hypothetical protein